MSYPEQAHLDVEGDAASRPPAMRVGGKRRRVTLPEPVMVSLPLLLAIIGLGAYSAVKSPYFLTTSNVNIILEQAATLGLLTVGMTLLMVAGFLDLSVGALVSFISVVLAKMANGGASTAVLILVALGTGAAASTLTGSIIAAVGVAPFIFTLGGMSVFLSLGLIISQSQPIQLTGQTFVSLGVGKWLGIPAAGVLFFGAVIVGGLLLRYSRLGRHAYAIGANRQAAFLAGVPIKRVTIGLFLLSGLLVGVAACVQLGRLDAGDPNAGVGLELQAVAAVVLGGASLNGGKGTMWGSMLGVLFLAEVANSLNLLGIAIAYQQLVYGGVLMVAVVAAALREHPQFTRHGLQRWRSRFTRDSADSSNGSSVGAEDVSARQRPPIA